MCGFIPAWYKNFVIKAILMFNSFIPNAAEAHSFFDVILVFLLATYFIVSIITIGMFIEDKPSDIKHWSSNDAAKLLYRCIAIVLIFPLIPVLVAVVVPLLKYTVFLLLFCFILFLLQKMSILFIVATGLSIDSLPTKHTVSMLWLRLKRYVALKLEKKAEKDLDDVSSVYRSPRCPTCSKEYKNA
jgi:hypothetical protein